MKYFKSINITSLVLSFLVLGLATIIQSCAPEEAKAEMSTEKKAEIKYPIVSTVSVTAQTFEHFFEVQGAIKANKNVIVTPEVGGLIRSIRVREGQFIKRGQTIATFNSDMVNSNLAEIEERIITAKYMYDKQKSLYEKGVGTELALKQAEGQYNAILKTKSTLNTQKGKFAVHAPFSGYVEKLFPVVGQLAGPTSPIIQLINLNDLSVVANVSESYLKDLSLSNKVSLMFPALDKTIEDLTLYRIGKMVNPIDRTLPIEVKIPKPEGNMVPNLMVVLKVRDYMKENALVIPSRTILKNAKQEDFVLVLQSDKTVKSTVIQTGNIYNNNTEIIEGIKVGDQIIDRGSRKVVDGDKVKVQN